MRNAEAAPAPAVAAVPEQAQQAANAPQEEQPAEGAAPAEAAHEDEPAPSLFGEIKAIVTAFFVSLVPGRAVVAAH